MFTAFLLFGNGNIYCISFVWNENVQLDYLCLETKEQQLSGKGPKTQYDPSHKCMYRGDMIASVVKQDKSAQVQDPFIPSPVEKLIAMSGSVNSVNCNSTMSMQLETWIADEFYSQAANYTLMVSLVAIAEVLVLIYQMGQSKTQTVSCCCYCSYCEVYISTDTVPRRLLHVCHCLC